LALYEQLINAVDAKAGRWHRQELMWTYRNLGQVLQKAKRYPEAEQAQRQALAVGEKLEADFPGPYRDLLAGGENKLGLAVGLLPGSEGSRPQARRRAGQESRGAGAERRLYPQYLGRGSLSSRRLESRRGGAGEVDGAPPGQRRLRLVLPGDGPLATRQ